MKYVNKLAELADRFEMKIKRAQTTGAQSGDVESALKAAGLWITSDTIAPLLNTAKCPDNLSLNISIVVDKGLNVKFNVVATPPHPSAAALAQLLTKTYAAKMSQALKAAQLTVADTITAGLATFA